MAVEVILWVAVVVAAVAVAALARRANANRQRIEQLEARLVDIGKAEAIITRAHLAVDERKRDRSHLKLLALIPAVWLLERIGNRPFVAAAATVTAMATAGAITVVERHIESPPAIAGALAGPPATFQFDSVPTPDGRTSSTPPSTTSTTSTIPESPPAEVVPLDPLAPEPIREAPVDLDTPPATTPPTTAPPVTAPPTTLDDGRPPTATTTPPATTPPTTAPPLDDGRGEEAACPLDVELLDVLDAALCGASDGR